MLYFNKNDTAFIRGNMLYALATELHVKFHKFSFNNAYITSMVLFLKQNTAFC